MPTMELHRDGRSRPITVEVCAATLWVDYVTLTGEVVQGRAQATYGDVSSPFVWIDARQIVRDWPAPDWHSIETSA
jgi:hypothetical protein